MRPEIRDVKQVKIWNALRSLIRDSGASPNRLLDSHSNHSWHMPCTSDIGLERNRMAGNLLECRWHLKAPNRSSHKCLSLMVSRVVTRSSRGLHISVGMAVSLMSSICVSPSQIALALLFTLQSREEN